MLGSHLFRNLGLIVLGGLASVWGYHRWTHDPTLVKRVAELEAERVGLLRRIAFLKDRQRVARIEVLDQFADPEAVSGQRTRLRFTELGSDGAPLAPGQEFLLDGNLVYVDAQVIKFDPDFAASEGLEYGSTLLMFRRLFGEHQAPAEGFPLDRREILPPSRSAEESRDAFTAELWLHFWDYANRPEVLKKSGVHAMHGEAPSIRLQANRTYLLELRTTDGLTIKAESTTVPTGN